jgi:hypothetical protein
VHGGALPAGRIIDTTTVRTRINGALPELPLSEPTRLLARDAEALERLADVLAVGRLQRLGLALLPTAAETGTRGRALQRSRIALA